MIPATEEQRLERSQVDLQPIQSDHRTIRSLMEHIDLLLARLADGQNTVEDEAQRMLDEFGRLLGSHLEREEDSKVLEHAAIDAPRYADRIEALLVEHGDLRRGLSQLCDGCGEMSWPLYYVRFREFRAVLVGHEQAENEVLANVYMDDIGGHH